MILQTALKAHSGESTPERLILQREWSVPLADAMADAVPMNGWLRIQAAPNDLAAAFLAYAEGGDRTRQAREVALLARLFTAECNVPRLRLWLGWHTRRECPLFHVDGVGWRLLCAYLGPGSEYLEDNDADRSKIGEKGRSPGADSVCKHGRVSVRRVPSQAIALFSGSAEPNSAGVVHRSPPTSHRCPRLFLRIDQA